MADDSPSLPDAIAGIDVLTFEQVAKATGACVEDIERLVEIGRYTAVMVNGVRCIEIESRLFADTATQVDE